MTSHLIEALVFVTPERTLVPLLASPGADPSWATFLKVPAELPEAGGLWVLTAMWLPEVSRYSLTGFTRPTLLDHAQLGLGTWRPSPCLDMF